MVQAARGRVLGMDDIYVCVGEGKVLPRAKAIDRITEVTTLCWNRPSIADGRALSKFLNGNLEGLGRLYVLVSRNGLFAWRRVDASLEKVLPVEDQIHVFSVRRTGLGTTSDCTDLAEEKGPVCTPETDHEADEDANSDLNSDDEAEEEACSNDLDEDAEEDLEEDAEDDEEDEVEEDAEDDEEDEVEEDEECPSDDNEVEAEEVGEKDQSSDDDMNESSDELNQGQSSDGFDFDDPAWSD